MRKIQTRDVWIAAVSFTVFFFMFFDNILSTAPYQAFAGFQIESQRLVTSRIALTVAEGPKAKAGFLIDGSEPYLAQYGLQGRILGIIGRPLYGPAPYIANFMRKINFGDLSVTDVVVRCLEALVAATTAAAITGVVYWIYAEFGFVAFLSAFAAVVVCPALTVFGRNLYWVPATWFLPMGFSAFWLFYAIKFRWHKAIIIAGLLVGEMFLIYIKSLCGYEYLSTVVIAAGVPVVYYGIKCCWPRRTVLVLLVSLGVGSIAGFSGALVTHGHQVAVLQHKASVWDGLDIVVQKAAVRTCGADCKQLSGKILSGYNADEMKLVSTSYFVVLVKYLINFKTGAIPIIPAFVWILVLVLATKKLLRQNTPSDTGVAVAAWVSMLAPMSWYILAKPHSAIHTMMNYVLWSVPFTVMVAVAAARAWNPDDRLIIGEGWASELRHDTTNEKDHS